MRAAGALARVRSNAKLGCNCEYIKYVCFCFCDCTNRQFASFDYFAGRNVYSTRQRARIPVEQKAEVCGVPRGEDVFDKQCPIGVAGSVMSVSIHFCPSDGSGLLR